MSHYNNYPYTTIQPGALVYSFVSSGPAGEFQKIVQFAWFEESGFFYLSFGDYNAATRRIDDRIINNNGNRNKVLATVETVVEDFFKRYPDARIIFGGSTPSRNRLYRMAINLNYDHLINKYRIIGMSEDGSFGPFYSKGNFTAFMIEKR